MLTLQVMNVREVGLTGILGPASWFPPTTVPPVTVSAIEVSVEYDGTPEEFEREPDDSRRGRTCASSEVPLQTGRR